MRLRVVSAMMLTLSLIGMLALAFNIQSAEASGTIYIKADGSIEGTDKIHRNGDVYTLTEDINGSIVVKKDNVVVDGAGHALQGTLLTSVGIGINLTSRNNITIKNIQVSYFNYGIYLLNSINIDVFRNNITTNGHGIYLNHFSNYNNVSKNYVTANKHHGIYLFNSSNNTITRNTVENNAEYGIMLIYSSNNNTIYHNNFINNTVQVYSFDSVDFWDQNPPPHSINIWDNEYPSGGNYWSDYTYIDHYQDPYQNRTGSDGIWDYPYVIDPLNQDNYPFVPEFPTPLILPLLMIATLLAVMVYRRKHST